MTGLRRRATRRSGDVRLQAHAAAEEKLAREGRKLDEALAAYAAARSGRCSVGRLRAAYSTAVQAYDRTTRAAAAVEQDHPRTVDQRLAGLGAAQQQFLLTGSYADGTLLPTYVRVSSRAATGPHIPGMDFEPRDPLGPVSERTIGVDLARVLDGLATVRG